VLLVEAEFDNMLDYVRSGIDAIEFTATGSLSHCNVPVNSIVGEN